MNNPEGGYPPQLKEVIKMNRTEIEQLFRTLAMSQGAYGRLLASIYNLPAEEQEEFWAGLEAQNFSDMIDVIMYIEGA